MEFNYVFNIGEPSILTEIYLPKKARYQGTLFQTLTDGFKLNYHNHFKGDKEEKIKELLKEYFKIDDIYDKFVQRERRVFWGYSLSEADGVFYSPITNPEYYEEVTQIIKIIFKPNYNELLEEINTLPGALRITKEDLIHVARNVFRTSYRDRFVYDIDEFRKRVKQKISNKNTRIIIDKIHCWKDEVGLFLFGYILFELSQGVNKIENEIWVTVNWHYTVNRITKKK